MSGIIKLGTRRSLLAWAQSSWVAHEIERVNHGTSVELVGIETRGDRVLDVSLQNIEGKEFFVAELDDALRSGQVDLTVHSMKDLSLDRPAEFFLAAIPPRENPRDVVLFGPGAQEKLRTGGILRIGTSSPRRLENIPSFLERAIPGRPRLEFLEIRGNVNSRLARVHEDRDSGRYLDAVVLAFAGMIRLWNDQKGREELIQLLGGVRWMVLPLRECPAAPAQGALAVECRKNDSRIREMLGKLNHSESAEHVAVERKLLAEWGGGCHQRFGATSIAFGASALFFVRGMKPDGKSVDELRWDLPISTPSLPIVPWDGTVWRQETASEPLPGPFEAATSADGAQAAFVAHSRALPLDWEGVFGTGGAVRIWTSGTASWFRLAERGVWVEGCAEGLGFEGLLPTLGEPVLRLPLLNDWTILTHRAAVEGWSVGKVVPTYWLVPEKDSQTMAKKRESVQAATHLYWSSGSQFEELRGWAREDGHHACGPGKTAQVLRSRGLKPEIFPSVKEWREWLGR